MSLCLRAGGPYITDPGRLVREMSNSTLALWMATAVLDPWGENRADERAARVAAAAVNGPHWKKESGLPYGEDEFLPYHAFQRDPVEVEARRQADLSARLRSAFLGASGHKAKAN